MGTSGWEWGQGTDQEGHKELWEGGGNVPYLDRYKSQAFAKLIKMYP